MKELKLPQAIQQYTKGMMYEKNEVGRSNATLYYFSNKDKEYYLKIEKTNPVFEHEQNVMKWLKGRLPVPQVIAQCTESGYDYLLMTKVAGEMAFSEQYLKNPSELVRLLAEAIKMLQSVNISDCPYDYTLKSTFDLARKRIDNNEVDMNEWKDSTKVKFNSPKELYDYLVANKPEEELVFSHGDYCLPNVFFNNEKVSGFIDLGCAGISDKWLDIALGIRSLEYNLQSKEYTNLLFECLNIEPNYEKINYYLLLNELF